MIRLIIVFLLCFMGSGIFSQSWKAATKEIRVLAKNGDEFLADKYIHELLEEFQKDSKLKLEIAQIWGSMGHQKKLLKTCNEILRQFDAQYIPASLLKARTLSAAKKNKAALSTLYKALEVDQNYYQTHYEIAQCLFRDDKTSQVQLHLFSALDNNFNHAASHLLLSKAYLNQGAYGKSLQSALFYFYSIQQCAVSIEYYDELESYFEAHVQNLFDAMGDHTGFRQYYHDRLERITTISVQEKNSIKDSSNFHHDQLFHVLYTEKLIRLKKEGLLEPFFHAAITQAGNEDSILWLQQHPEDLEALFSWIEAGML